MKILNQVIATLLLSTTESKVDANRLYYRKLEKKVKGGRGMLKEQRCSEEMVCLVTSNT